MRSSTQVLRRSSSLVLAGAALLALGLSGPVAAQTLETGPIKVTDSGSITPNGYALKGVTGTANNAGLFGYGNVSSSAINIDGVVGYVQTQQSVGVVGWSASTGTSAYGLYGYSATGPGVYGFNANGGAPSIYGSNTTANGIAVSAIAGTGTGVEGTGIDGIVGFGESSTSAGGNGGVLGVDDATAGGNWGVAGVSTLSGGVFGLNTGTGTGQAIEAYSSTASDAIDSFQYGGGTSANDFYDDAGLVDGFFEAGTGAGAAIFAGSDASSSAFAGGEANGIALEAAGGSGSVTAPVLAAEENATGTYPFVTYQEYASGGGPGPNQETYVISDSANYSGLALPNGSDVNVSGDLYVAGRVYTDCEQVNQFPENSGGDCANGPYVKTPGGARVRTYSSSQSLPTMEDFGEANLVNGQAAVTLEHTFASTIDQRRSYLVFITPEGDSNGLYIASKTPNGFVVRESKGGHSSLTFQYRIVAHPVGDTSTRLATITRKHVTISHPPTNLIANMHSKVAMALLAKSKAARDFATHHLVRRPAMPAKYPLPLVNPALFNH